MVRGRGIFIREFAGLLSVHCSAFDAVIKAAKERIALVTSKDYFYKMELIFSKDHWSPGKDHREQEVNDVCPAI